MEVFGAARGIAGFIPICYLVRNEGGARMTANLHRALEDYRDFWRTVSARTLPLLGNCVTPAVRYEDPLHDCRGVEAFAALIRERLSAFDRVWISVTDSAFGQDGFTVYVRWEAAATRKARSFSLSGVSEIQFSPDGKVASHIDHWDTGVLYREGGIWKRLSLLPGG